MVSPMAHPKLTLDSNFRYPCFILYFPSRHWQTHKYGIAVRFCRKKIIKRYKLAINLFYYFDGVLEI